MIKLADAISNRFPQGNDWAAQALRTLEGDLDPATPVHDVVEGWTRDEPTGAPVLIDTLFVLAADRLGLGQVGGDPRWLALVDIVAVDAVDNSPLPLQTIELELASGETVCVGWPETFSESLVAVLQALAAAAADDARSDDLFSATALDEVSIADEPPATGPKPIVAAIDFLNPAAPPDVVDEPVDGPWPAEPWEAGGFEPAGPMATMPEPAPAEPADPGMFSFDVAAADPTLADDSVSDAWFSVGDTEVGEPAPTASSFADAPDLTMPADEPVSPPAPSSGVEPPPWQTPGMTWPDPLRGVVYLGGHPSHPRKRKNGTMVFSPHGLEVRGGGFHDWEMTMDWGYVDQLDVQGPDEIMFGDQLKIDASSSAVIVVMNDGTRMFFEVRTRRPPSLRSSMAPMLLMVDNIRTWRAQQPRG